MRQPYFSIHPELKAQKFNLWNLSVIRAINVKQFQFVYVVWRLKDTLLRSSELRKQMTYRQAVVQKGHVISFCIWFVLGLGVCGVDLDILAHKQIMGTLVPWNCRKHYLSRVS